MEWVWSTRFGEATPDVNALSDCSAVRTVRGLVDQNCDDLLMDNRYISALSSVMYKSYIY